jgi:hypothetical protein
MSVDRLLFDDAATRQRDHNEAADTPTSVADVPRDNSESAQLRSVVRADNELEVGSTVSGTGDGTA